MYGSADGEWFKSIAWIPLVSLDEMDQLKYIQEKEAAGLLWIWGKHRGLCGLPHCCIVTPKFIRQENSPSLST